MSCNSCAKPFSILRKEKGCPGCGFSYCSNCLANKVFVPKLNTEAKVCAKCTKTTNPTEQKRINPPDAYYKRLGILNNQENKNGNDSTEGNTLDQEIHERLQKLKQDRKTERKLTAEEEISERLKGIKEEVPSTSDAELQSRLANLRGVPLSTIQTKPMLPVQVLKSEQEEVDELMKQYMDQSKIDKQYKDGFDASVNDIESRVQKLKGNASTSVEKNIPIKAKESKNNEETIKNTIERAKLINSDEDKVLEVFQKYMYLRSKHKKYPYGVHACLYDLESGEEEELFEDNASNIVKKKKPIKKKTKTKDEEETIRNIVERVKAESSLEENEIDPVKNDELPFCEICNKDARMRCLGCRYLFCRRCFIEHKDDDDECNKYELYEPPKATNTD